MVKQFILLNVGNFISYIKNKTKVENQQIDEMITCDQVNIILSSNMSNYCVVFILSQENYVIEFDSNTSFINIICSFNCFTLTVYFMHNHVQKSCTIVYGFLQWLLPWHAQNRVQPILALLHIQWLLLHGEVDEQEHLINFRRYSGAQLLIN